MDGKGPNKHTACEPIAGILDDLVRSCQGGAGQNARAVWDFWDGVVGERTASHAQPAAFRQRTLVVHVSSSTWLQELHFQKNELIERLNRTAGANIVEDIRFKLGSLPVK